MILIFSLENDNSTNDVIDWIIHKTKKSPYRINDSQSVNGKFLINVSDSEQIFITDSFQNKILFKNINAIWYRRSYDPTPPNIDALVPNDVIPVMKISLKNELRYTHYAIHHSLKNKYFINDLFTSKNDKLQTLFAAKEVGLDIPDTIVTNSTMELSDFFATHSEDIIVKSIYNLSSIKYSGGHYFPKTTKLNKGHLTTESKIIFPLLAQKNIKKKYEIRAFCLDSKLYGMAIFSQGSEQTSQDFRNYNLERPNRTVPYKLNEEISSKLLELMKKINLNCGSIDLIKGADDKYYFLEVNPVGQFGMVSYPCNYYIEDEISNLLIKNGIKTKEYN